MTKFYVYEHWRLDRDECFYVGKGKGGRAFNLSNRNSHHKAIVGKLSREGSGMEVRMVSTGITEDAAFKLEVERIAFWREIGVDLANHSNGGEGKTGPHSIEHRLKISKSNTGNKITQKQKDAVSISNKRRKGNKMPPRSAEHIKALSASLIGRSAPNKKMVQCLSDGIVFKSATSAAKNYGLRGPSTISDVCNGKRKHTKGLVFSYIGYKQ
jgi:hypothetical protein